ncbi:MAG TPA: hypothetical protein VKD72_25065 [Gemmataceae bacterium]|nr:hypothetical protein [Gemmataceae bacterium]
MPDANGSWRVVFGCFTAVGLSAAAGLAGTLAARACVVAWWQNLGAAGAWIEVLGTLAGAGLGVALVLALLRLLTDALALRRLASLPGQPERPTWAQVLSRGLVAVLLLSAFGALMLIGLRGLKWQEVSPPGSGFQVMMPGIPIEQEEEEDTPQGPARGKRFLSRARDNFQAYAVEFVDYPEEYVRRNSAADIFKSQKDAVVPSEGRLVSEELITLSGFPGTELQLETDDDRLMIFRMYLVKRRLFLLLAKCRKGTRPREVDTFFNSFTFTGG